MGGIRPYYERDGITIYNGCCLEIMPQLVGLFDAIICDLPYGTTACSWDEVIPFEPLWTNYKRLVKKTGAVVLFGCEPFSSKLRLSNLEWYKYDWGWDKSRPSNFLNSKKQPLRVFELISVFYKSQCMFNPQLRSREKKNIRDPKRAYTSRNNTYGETRQDWVYNSGREIPLANGYPLNLLEFVCVGTFGNKRVHPTQKPVDLLAYLIRAYTNPGEIILDNTMGSGTTLVAAQREGRRAVGIEISEDYCQIAVERLRQPTFFSIPNQPKTEKPKQLTLLEGAT